MSSNAAADRVAPVGTTGTEPRDDSRRIYLLTGVFSAVLYTVLLVAPVIAGPLIAKFSLDPAEVGLLFSIELGAFSLATVPAYLWLTRVPLKWAVAVATVIVAVGHVLSGIVEDFGMLLVVRAITSLAAGSITVVLLALGPRTKNPGRAFGIFVVAQLAMGALILFLFPLLYQGADVSAIYWTLAVLTLICLPFAATLNGVRLDAPPATAVGGGQGGGRVPLIAGLLAIVCFYIALSGVWSFMGQISVTAGNDEGATSIVLAIATVAGILSAFLATILGESRFRGLYLVIGFAVMAGAVFMLLGVTGLIPFAITAVVFKFGWTFVLPYLLSSVSALGGGAHSMNTVNLMIGGGFAIGPLLAGQLTQSSGGFGLMIVVDGILLVVALVLGIVLNRGRFVDASTTATADPMSGTSEARAMRI